MYNYIYLYIDICNSYCNNWLTDITEHYKSQLLSVQLNKIDTCNNELNYCQMLWI